MPELTVSRTRPVPFPMVCMYCGGPATAKREWPVTNRAAGTGGGGTDIIPVPGDDPVSAVIGLVMLPIMLWDLLTTLGRSRTVAPKPTSRTSLRPPQTTLVAVTTCARHHRFRSRFVWTGAVMLVGLVALWVWAIVVTRRDMGTDHVGAATALILTALALSVALPIALSFWYCLCGPVIVDRVGENEVVLDRVRQAYFDVTGTAPGPHES